MKTLILPVTDKAMETLTQVGATPVPNRPGYANVPMGAVDLLFLPLGAVTQQISFAVTPPK